MIPPPNTTTDAAWVRTGIRVATTAVPALFLLKIIIFIIICGTAVAHSLKPIDLGTVSSALSTIGDALGSFEFGPITVTVFAINSFLMFVAVVYGGAALVARMIKRKNEWRTEWKGFVVPAIMLLFWTLLFLCIP